MRQDDDILTDEQIVERVLVGDTDLFHLLVKRYQKTVFSIGRRILRNDDDAYDFVQEAFLRAYAKLAGFSGSASFRFWLIKLAYHAAINMHHARKGSDTIGAEIVDESDRSAEYRYCADEIRDALRAAMTVLPGDYRICIDFHFFFGLSYAEIRDITGFPVNTIKSHVFRAKQILRDRLKGTIAEEYHEM